MVIGACGFTGSGSSAVSDYLKEFKSTKTIDRLEFILAHSPDGLEDLDHQLNKHCVKYTSSAVAIERFRKNAYNYLINRIGDKICRKQLVEATEAFIDAITQVKWRGYGSAHCQLRARNFYKSRTLNMFSYRMAIRILRKLPPRMRRDWRHYPARDMAFSVCPENFDELAKNYVTRVLEILGADFTQKIVLDQPFSGNCPQNSFKYFDDPKAIVVDRDPRDVYILAKEFYHSRGIIYQIPTDTVENFVNYYKYMRKDQPYRLPDERILTIWFEDMVYEYERTTSKIRQFCGLDLEDREGQHFFPEKSINNTQIYKRYPQHEKDIRYIEQQLPEYLYPFEKYGDIEVTGEMFDKA